MNSRKTCLPVHIPGDFARIYSVDSSTSDAKGLVVGYKPDAVLVSPDVHFLKSHGFLYFFKMRLRWYLGVREYIQ